MLGRISLQDTSRGTHQFGLTLVGHSLGAGTAAILAILLKQEYPDLVCFSFGPPGGLLSMPAQQYSQEFITSVVVGKDVVPRIGLRQLESLRADLINAIKRSVDPKVCFAGFSLNSSYFFIYYTFILFGCLCKIANTDHPLQPFLLSDICSELENCEFDFKFKSNYIY